MSMLLPYNNIKGSKFRTETQDNSGSKAEYTYEQFTNEMTIRWVCILV